MTAPAAPAAPDFAALARRFDRAVRRTRRNADAAAIHDLRVATRRLGTLLQLRRGVLEAGLRRRTRRQLRRLRRDVAAARDLQVLLPAVRARRDSAPVPDAALDVWVRELEQDVAAEVATAARRCDAAPLAELRGALRACGVALSRVPTRSARRR